MKIAISLAKNVLTQLENTAAVQQLMQEFKKKYMVLE